MLRSFLAALLCLTLAAAPLSTRAEVVIDHDLGGEVKKYNQRFFQYKSNDEDVIIAGTCMSACTRFMTLPHVCAEPNGYFYFHGITIDGKVDPKAGLEDSRRWESPAAIKLQVKYGANTFGMVKGKTPQDVLLEPGVWRAYTEVMPGFHQVWLKVKADKLVPAC